MAPRDLYRWPEILTICRWHHLSRAKAKKTPTASHLLATAPRQLRAASGPRDCVKALANRDVIILEDADEAGRKKALAAAYILDGIAATIRIVRLPDLTGHPNNKDVSDWLDADPGRAEKLIDICFSVPLGTPVIPELNVRPETKNDDSGKSTLPQARRRRCRSSTSWPGMTEKCQSENGRSRTAYPHAR